MEWPSLKALIRNSSVDLHEEQEQLTKYQHVFSKSDWDLGATSKVQYYINIGSATPIRQKSTLETGRDRQVNNLVKEEMGYDSNSPWLSPVILVTKKEASQKLCLDHRQLDSVTVKDAISQPRINDSLDGPSGTSGISTLDVWHPGKGRLALEGLQALSYVKLHKRWTIRNEIAYHLD